MRYTRLWFHSCPRRLMTLKYLSKPRSRNRSASSCNTAMTSSSADRLGRYAYTVLDSPTALHARRWLMPNGISQRFSAGLSALYLKYFLDHAALQREFAVLVFQFLEPLDVSSLHAAIF